jgi:hypothetical protein
VAVAEEGGNQEKMVAALGAARGWRRDNAKKRWWRLGRVRQPLGLAQRKNQALITMLVERDCRGIGWLY